MNRDTKKIITLMMPLITHVGENRTTSSDDGAKQPARSRQKMQIETHTHTNYMCVCVPLFASSVKMSVVSLVLPGLK